MNRQEAIAKKILDALDKAKPPKVEAKEFLTPEFMAKHTKFASFEEMVELAVKESGYLEQYLENLKKTLAS